MNKCFVVMILLIFGSSAFAQETIPAATPEASQTVIQPNPEPSTVAVVEVLPINSRRGFVIGAGIGGGGMHIGSGNDFHKGAVIGGLRVGGGLTERFLIMGEAFSAWTKDSGVHTTISTINFSAQWFCYKNLYLRPGVGFSMLSTSSTSGKVTTTFNSDDGVSVIGAVGYEFRLGEVLGLSPEIYYNYDHVNGANVSNYGAVIAAMFYL